MKYYKKLFKIPSSLLIFVLCLHNVRTQSTDSWVEKPDIPIIRQINKVNDDGTYTYGYEAADGRFKVETRDVLGNVKGMFGFVNESGDLKRVSYTENNETGVRSSVVQPSVSTTVRPSELRKRPILLMKTIPDSSSSTTGPVVTKKWRDGEEEEEDEETSTGRGYARNHTSEDSVNKVNPLRRVLVSKRPIEDKEVKGKGGNSLRRQLNQGLLRGETSHLSTLISQLRPIQLVRGIAPQTITYQAVDVEGGSSQEAIATTELPYGTSKPPAVAAHFNIFPQRIPLPVEAEESHQYVQEIPHPHFRRSNLPRLPPHGFSPPIPQSIPTNLVYQTQPQYYDHGSPMIQELMAIIYNYLQVKLNQFSQNVDYSSRFLPNPNPYSTNLLFASPSYPYLMRPNYSPIPYSPTPQPHYYPNPFVKP